jgi:UDPglucose--hexose-1-phosphate uridylyltransferase
MTELRRDPIIGQWVIVHSSDPWGPERYEKEDHSPRQAATCPFCPGKESMTPPEVSAVRPFGSAANSSGWEVRVVSNKFPALKIEGNIDARQDGIFESSNGIGAHEVLIETPQHVKHLGDFTILEMLKVVDQYQNRLLDLSGDKRFKYITIFKNYGESAGTSVEHPHSQIIALPMIPKHVLQELEGARHYHEAGGRCVYCDMITQEHQDKERVVAENGEFIAFCPFVPRYPFECWILPKRHDSSFAAMNEREELAFARIFKEVLYRIKTCLHDPAFNYYLHISPVNYENQKSFHWHVEIVPQLIKTAGFERGTGFYVVHTSPEKAAEHLRHIAYDFAPQSA